MKVLLALAVLAGLVALGLADMYMMNPGGCQNKLNEAQENTDNNNRLCDTQTNSEGGHFGRPPPYYYAGSELSFMWMVQHSCGAQGESKETDCDIIVQYMCEDNQPGLRGGDIDGGADARQTVGTNGAEQNRGMHEGPEFYAACTTRTRNEGLFLADQNLQGDTAQYTRQNAAGTRYGLECPEERDYYPYWHPSPWNDIAVLTTNLSRCEFYQQNSQNVAQKGSCSVTTANNPDACSAAGGNWIESGRHNIPAPFCGSPPLSPVNHNGNAADGNLATYNATLDDKYTNQLCVARLRYNMSSGDYDGWNTDAAYNGQLVANNPTVTIEGAPNSFDLALATNQIARTFEDRSHPFEVRARDSNTDGCRAIKNLNCRGRRGNNDQAYPASEYHYAPDSLVVGLGECVHVMCSNSDYNDQNAAGQGQAGLDRSNICGMLENDPTRNYIAEIDDAPVMFPKSLGNDWGPTVELACMAGGDGGELDNALVVHDVGVIKQTDSGESNFMNTRNNNYTNRSQKGYVRSGILLSAAEIALIVVGSLMVAGAVAFGGAFMYAKKNPDTQVAAWFHKHNMARPSSASRGKAYRG